MILVKQEQFVYHFTIFFKKSFERETEQMVLCMLYLTNSYLDALQRSNAEVEYLFFIDIWLEKNWRSHRLNEKNVSHEINKITFLLSPFNNLLMINIEFCAGNFIFHNSKVKEAIKVIFKTLNLFSYLTTLKVFFLIFTWYLYYSI